MEYVGKYLTATESGRDHAGLCTSTRTVSQGTQVFLEIPGGPGRYFFVKDLKPPVLKKRKKIVTG